MPKSESELKTELVRSLRSYRWYARRIEDQYGVGIPDILVGIPYGPTIMVEAKVVKGQSFGPTPRQLVELKRWEYEGGHELGATVQRISWLLGFKEGLMYLHPTAASARIDDCMPSHPDEHPTTFMRRFLHKCLVNAKLP